MLIENMGFLPVTKIGPATASSRCGRTAAGLTALRGFAHHPDPLEAEVCRRMEAVRANG